VHQALRAEGTLYPGDICGTTDYLPFFLSSLSSDEKHNLIYSSLCNISTSFATLKQ